MLKVKNTLIALSFLVLSVALMSAAISPQKSVVVPPMNTETCRLIVETVPELPKINIEDFLKMTPAKYKKMTGKRLGLKKTLQLKFAQKKLNKYLNDSEKLSKGVYILLAIVGLGFVGLGLLNDWKGDEWLICLLLGVLCWLPGVIYALVKMKNYYK